MGLDQYAYKRDADEDEDGNITIAEWRKHNRLHGWMEELWIEKGKPNFQEEYIYFNTIPLELDMIDLERLEEDIKDKTMPETKGFFFGNDSFGWEDEDGKDYEGKDYYYKDKDLEFIKDAFYHLGEDRRIYYNSSW